MSSPPLDQIVVRGGTLHFQDLERNALMSVVQLGKPGFSVHSAPADTPSELLANVGDDFPHMSVSFATVGALIDVGFDVEQTFDPPHHTVWIPQGELSFWVTQFRTTMSHVVDRASADSVLPLT